MFPGSNLLNQAFRAIRPIEIQWHSYANRTLSDAGLWVSAYNPAVPVMASVQAVNRDRYEYMGLDFAKNYFALYMSNDAHDLQRDTAPDRFILPNGLTYEVVSENDWFGIDGIWPTGIDGWTAVIVVQLPRNTVTPLVPAPEPEPEPLP